MKKAIAIIGLRGYPPEFSGAGGIDFYIQKILPNEIKKYRQATLYVRSWANPTETVLPRKLSIIKIPTVNSKHLDTPIYALFASLFASFTRAEIVWYHAPGSALFLFIPKLLGKKIYLTLHGIDWKRQKWNKAAKLILKFAEWLSVGLSDRLFVVSNILKKYLKKNFNKESELMTVKLFKSRRLKAKKIYKLFGLNEDEFILFIGRFVPEKRVEWLIHAYTELNNLNKIKLVLAGKKEITKYSKRLIKETKADKRILWPGFVSGREKSELLSNCRVFVLPSSMEGSSMALLEALSYDRRCLVSDIRTHKELAESNGNIVTFKRDSYHDFLNRLKEIVER